MRRSTCAVLLCLLLPATVLPAANDPLDPTEATPAVRRAVFRAEAAHGRDQTAKAVRILTDALAAGDDRDHPSLRYRLGAYLLELERFHDAIDHMRRACELADDSKIAWRDYARAAYEIGEYETAAHAFTRACDTGVHADHEVHADHVPDPTLMYYSAVSWILAGRPVKAVDILVPLIEAVRETVPCDWVRTLVSAAASCDQPASADRAVDRLMHEHPDDPTTWVLASQHAQIRDDLPTAAIRLQVADWLTPLPLKDIRRLAELFGAAGVPRLAARCYARLWPADPEPARPLAIAWMQAHEPDSARVVLHASLDAEPDAAMWTLLGDLEYSVERWDEARQAFIRATSLDPVTAHAWLMQGACSLKLDEHATARPALNRAADLENTAPAARRLLHHLDSLTPSRK